MEQLQIATVVKHAITIKYKCPTMNMSVVYSTEAPRIAADKYNDSHIYKSIYIKYCPLCGKSHEFEI